MRLHVSADQSSPTSHVPRKPSARRPSPGMPAKSGDSGASPESTTPTTTPAPPRDRAWWTWPPASAVLRWATARLAMGRSALASTDVTSGSDSSTAAWSGVSSTAKPLSADVQR